MPPAGRGSPTSSTTRGASSRAGWRCPDASLLGDHQRANPFAGREGCCAVPPRGLLVTFEGVDGSGKSTAARSVAQALRARGLSVEERVEPTRTWLGESVRRGFHEALNPWSEAL